MKVSLIKEENENIKRITLKYSFFNLFLIGLVSFIPFIIIFVSSLLFQFKYVFLFELLILLWFLFILFLDKGSKSVLEYNKITKTLTIERGKSFFFKGTSIVIYEEDKLVLIASKKGSGHDLFLKASCFALKDNFGIKLLPNIAYHLGDFFGRLYIANKDIDILATFLNLKINYVEKTNFFFKNLSP